MKKYLYVVASIIFTFLILKEAQFIFAPLCLGLVFAVLLSPLSDKLEGIKMNRTMAGTLVTFSFFALLFASVYFISNQYISMANEMPDVQNKVEETGDDLVSFLGQKTPYNHKEITAFIDDTLDKMVTNFGAYFSSAIDSITGVISFLILLPVYTFLILINRKKIRTFIDKLSVENEHVSKIKWYKNLLQISNMLRKYLLGLIIVAGILAVLNITGLYLLGVKYALILGLSAAALSVIPYIWNIVGGGFALFVTYASSSNTWVLLGVLILFVVIQFIEGNLITPKIMGNQLGINPLIVIIALLIGGYVWGITGMILSLPAVAIFKILLSNNKPTEPLAVLISEEN